MKRILVDENVYVDVDENVDVDVDGRGRGKGASLCNTCFGQFQRLKIPPQQ